VAAGVGVSEPEETAAVQLERAAQDSGRPITGGRTVGITAEYPGGDGSIAVVYRDDCADNQMNCDRLLRFDANGDFDLDGEQKGDKDLTLAVEQKDFFHPRDDLDSRAVLTKHGITLVRRSPGEESGDQPFDHILYGAWMEHAGFAVAVDGDFIVPDGDGGTLRIPGRFPAFAGDWTDTNPTADATYKGLMVGTIREGDDKDDLLQGDAELTFDMASTTVDATFSNIYNLDKGAKHPIAEIKFEGATFDGLGYFDIYEDYGDLYAASLQGGFFGDDNAEVAGTFYKHNVSGAFGAKKVRNAGTTITDPADLSGDSAFRAFQARAIVAAGLPEEHEPGETAEDQLRRAGDALEYAGRPQFAGRSRSITVEYPDGDGSTAYAYRDSCAEDQMGCDRLLRFDAGGDFDLNGEQKGDKDLTLAVEKEDVFGLRDDLDSRAVLTKNGITLLHHSPGEASGDRLFDHTLYGAWMEHAGFVVAVDGAFAVADDYSPLPIPGRFAAFTGSWTGRMPDASATWKGLMVGTIRKGDNRGDILQGDAELTFDMDETTVDATFSNIYNIDKDARHPTAQIGFYDAVFEEDDSGYYYKEVDGEEAFLEGSFFGDNHAETAGAFYRNNVSGAFGAKKVTN